jgi:hypothetical protein
MRKSTAVLIVLLAAAGASTAAAQQPASPPAPAAGRVDVGGGFALGVPASTDGGSLFAWPLANAHAGVALNSRLALEGVFDIHPQPHDITAFYRIQVRWRLCDPAPGGLAAHLTAGGTGWFRYESQPAYRWRDANGNEEVFPAQSYWNGGPPVYPAIGIGLQKPLGTRVALRADVAAVIVPYDDGVTTLLLPTIGLTFPLGRPPGARSR